MRTFAQRLKDARERAGYTSAAQFAAVLGLEPHTYRKYERGASEANYDTIERICKLLHVTPNYLFPDAARAAGEAPPGNQRASAA